MAGLITPSRDFRRILLLSLSNQNYLDVFSFHNYGTLQFLGAFKA